MKCTNRNEKREEKITLYIDRQLDWKEEKEFLKHIKECPECKQKLQEAQQLRQTLLNMPMEEVPKGLHESILKSIEKEIEKEMKKEMKKSPAKKRIAWKKYGALAACFLILALAAKQYRNTNDINNTNTTAQMNETMEIAEIEETTEMLETAEIEETAGEINEISPTITQTRSMKAPETSKALPDTPILGGGAEALQEKSESEQTDEEQKEDISESVLSQPTLQKEATNELNNTLSNDENDETNDELSKTESQDNGTQKSESRKSVPSNMKSKSLQIKLKAKNADSIAEQIEKRTKAIKGEIESDYAEGSMTIKIPLSEYNNIVNWLGQQCEVIDKNEITEDLAKQYKEIQRQADNAKEKEKEAIKKGQSRRAQDAVKIQKECENALEELEKTAQITVISITFIE